MAHPAGPHRLRAPLPPTRRMAYDPGMAPAVLRGACHALDLIDFLFGAMTDVRGGRGTRPVLPRARPGQAPYSLPARYGHRFVCYSTAFRRCHGGDGSGRVGAISTSKMDERSCWPRRRESGSSARPAARSAADDQAIVDDLNGTGRCPSRRPPPNGGGSERTCYRVIRRRGRGARPRRGRAPGRFRRTRKWHVYRPGCVKVVLVFRPASDGWPGHLGDDLAPATTRASTSAMGPREPLCSRW